MSYTYILLGLGLGLFVYVAVLRPLFAKRIERRVKGLCRNMGQRILAEPLMAKVREGELDSVRTVLKHCKIDPDMADEQGWTALGYAVQARNMDMALLLLHAGADPRRRYPDGRTPLDLARLLEQPDMVRMLASFAEREDREREERMGGQAREAAAKPGEEGRGEDPATEADQGGGQDR